ncbi:hypothetical protein WDW86_08715 [Bdellovibrionota bacterium FG-2]
MKTIMLILALSLTSLMQLHSALANDREDLTPGLLDEIQAVKDGMKKTRVYLSRSLHINRTDYIGESDSSVVGGGLEKTIKDKRRNEDIPRNARGQIIEIKDEHVWIAFDKDCESRECAFHFQFRARENDTSRFPKEKFIFNNAPKNPDFRTVTYRATSFWFGILRTSEIIHLEVKYDEIHEFITEYKTHPGVDAPDER